MIIIAHMKQVIKYLLTTLTFVQCAIAVEKS